MKKMVFLSIFFAIHAQLPALAFDLDANTVAYWDFNTSSAYINDLSGHYLSGTLYGTIYEESAVRFNGTSSSYAVFPAIDPYLTIGTLTLQAEIKISNYPIAEGTDTLSALVGYISTAISESYGYQLRLVQHGGQCFLEFALGRTGSVSPVVCRSNLAMNLGQWYDIGAQYNGESLTVYIDGNRTGGSFYAGDLHLNNGLCYVGKEASGTVVHGFDGLVKEIAVSGSTRFLDSIINAFDVDSRTIGLWRFNELSGMLVYDSSENGYNGQLLSGVERRIGKYGRSIYASSSESYAILPKLIELENSEGFRIEAIINIPSYNSNITNPIFHIGREDDFSFTLSVGLDHQKVLGVLANNRQFGVEMVKYNLSDSFFGNWQKVGVVYLLGQIRLYINDSLVQTGTVSPIDFALNYETYIGGDTWHSSVWNLNGYIDEVKVSTYTESSAPVLLFPEDGAEIDYATALRWRNENKLIGYLFKMQVSENPNFTSFIEYGLQYDDTAITLAEIDDDRVLPILTPLFWRMRVESQIDSSDWSPISFFYISNNSKIEANKVSAAKYGFDIWPNPCSKAFSLRVSIARTGDYSAEIVNLKGELVSTLFTKKLVRGDNQIGIREILHMPSGVYLIKIHGKNVRYYRKLFIVR